MPAFSRLAHAPSAQPPPPPLLRPLRLTCRQPRHLCPQGWDHRQRRPALAAASNLPHQRVEELEHHDACPGRREGVWGVLGRYV